MQNLLAPNFLCYNVSIYRLSGAGRLGPQKKQKKIRGSGSGPPLHGVRPHAVGITAFHPSNSAR